VDPKFWYFCKKTQSEKKNFYPCNMTTSVTPTKKKLSAIYTSQIIFQNSWYFICLGGRIPKMDKFLWYFSFFRSYIWDVFLFFIVTFREYKNCTKNSKQKYNIYGWQVRELRKELCPSFFLTQSFVPSGTQVRQCYPSIVIAKQSSLIQQNSSDFSCY